MSSRVWACFPTACAEHVPGILSRWREMGYAIAILTDAATVDESIVRAVSPDLRIHVGEYPGVWRAWNMLAKTLMASGTAEVCVLVGDDMEPDPHKKAGEIADEYHNRFPLGEGVMQPTGDRQGDRIDGKWNSQRICGSPWVGEQWIRLAYRGSGPVNGDYTAFFADEELQLLASSLGLLWQRDDLCQKHLHWSWGHLPKRPYHDRNQAVWVRDSNLFKRNKDIIAQGQIP